MTTFHQLKVTLKTVKPPVWRRVGVSSDLSLAELGAILEGAMGWMGSHLHIFDVDGTTYGIPDPDQPEDELDEGDYRLGDVLPDEGAKMLWDYDFGDGWEHDIVVEKIAPPDPKVAYPVCLAGRRACPPEDCGGPHGYYHLLEALADLNHPEHEFLKMWAPPDFDPAYFDVDEATEAMRSPRPIAPW